MGQRMVRVNELVKREISEQLHTCYQAEAVNITITTVEVAPDLRRARVFFSVLGDPLDMRKATRFLNKIKADLRKRIGKKIVLKYLPHLSFFPDSSIQRGTEMLEKLDELEEEDDY